MSRFRLLINKIYYANLAVVLVLVSGCSSSVRVTSNPPGADVWAKPLGSGTRKNIGQTPLTFDPSNLEGVPSGNGPLSLEMLKDGYSSVDLLVTDIGSGNMEIHKDLVPGESMKDPHQLNKTLEKVFTAQQLIQLQELDEAEKLLTEANTSFSNIAVVHELLGGIYFLKGNKVQALSSFRKALALNPSSIDALNMTKELAETTPTTEEANP